MLDLVVQFVTEVVLFQNGRIVIYGLSFGRINPSLDSRWQPLVTLLGALVIIGVIVGAGIWFKMTKGQ
jgi:hypothetical protein